MEPSLKQVHKMIGRWRRIAALATLPGFGRVLRSSRLPAAVRRQLGPRITAVIGTVPAGARGVVTIISHEFAAAGAPKVLLEIVSALAVENWAVLIVGPDEGPFTTIFAEAGAVVIVSPDALTPRSPAVAVAPFSAAVLANTIACIDVIAALPPERTVWYLHETGAIDLYRQQHAKLSTLLTDVREVWATSSLVVRHLGADRPDAVVIPAISSPVTGTAEPGGRDTVQAVVMGSIERRKGQDLLLDAYRLLPDEVRGHLRIACHGRVLEPDFARALHARVTETPGFALSGPVSPSGAAAIIGEADMLIVCSRDEPLSLVAVEAMSAGRIVVCTPAAGIAAYVEDGVSGYVGADASPEGLRDVIVRALADRASWPSVAAGAQAAYARDFTPAAFRRAVMTRLAPIVAAGTRS